MSFAESRPIKDYCLGIFDGPHATPKESDEGPVFLGIKNITDEGRLDLSEIRHVSDQEYPKWTRRVTPRAGDVVLTYEATLHRYAIIPEGFRGCLGRRVALVRPDPEKVDNRYLLYFFLSRSWRTVVESNVITGATVDRVPLERFPNFPAILPRLDVQHRVADILSAYDDLIENNRRRMALLEEAARQLYREWFVRLRFPGHEHTHINKGVPDGWERRTFGELLAHHIGGGWGQDEPQGSETEESYVIRGTDIPEVEAGNFKAVGLRYHDPRRLPQRILQVGDIIFEVSGGSATQAIGRTLLITEEILRVLTPRAICASFCKLFRVSDPLLPFFLFRFLRHIRESGEISLFQKQSASALQNFQYQAFLGEQQVLLPTTVLLKEFCTIQATLLRQQQTLALQNHKLRAVRDLLLPRLISGEITV